VRKLIPAIWIGATVLVITGFAVSIYLVFITTGIERNLGFTQKIFYFHVPCAWITYLAFAITAICSIAYLIRRSEIWDAIAYSSIEIGTVFTTLVIITGPLWARPTWGAFWVWDARLTTTLILWLIELAYLLLRTFIEEPEKAAKYAAVVGLLGAIDIPIIHYSVVMWRGMHPAVMQKSAGGGGLPGDFFAALMVSMAAFTLLFIMLLIVRVHLQTLRGRIHELREHLLESGATR
jgi:heme exporter protein C